MDHADRLILSRLQEGLPIEAEPYTALAAETGLPEEEVLRRIRSLISNGVIRRIGPVINPRKFDRVTTLAALAVPGERIGEVAAIVSALPEVSHNYMREAEGAPVPLNLWFTLNARSSEALEEALSGIGHSAGLVAVNLPAKRVFKTLVRFDIGEGRGDGDGY